MLRKQIIFICFAKKNKNRINRFLNYFLLTASFKDFPALKTGALEAGI